MHKRPCSATGTQEVDEEVEDLSVQDRRHFKVLTRRRGPGKNEYSRPNDRADAERGQRPRPERLAKTMLGLLGLGDEFVDGFTAQELAAIGLCGRVGRR